MNNTDNKSTWHQSRYNLFAPIPGSKHYAGINTFSGSAGVFSMPELYLLSETESLPSGHPALERFKDLGMIVNFDEEVALRSMAGLASGVPFEVCLTICPTVACNFDCPYCFQNHIRGSMSQKVQDDTVALAEQLLKLSGAHKLRVRWFGGEPLLYPDIIDNLSRRLIDLADRYGADYKAWIITNGYLLTQDICDMLGRAKVTSAQITIDGPEHIHNATRRLAGGGGTFDKITTNLSTLKIPFKVKIRCNLHSENYKYKDDVKKLTEELALRSGNNYEFNPVFMESHYIKSKDKDKVKPASYDVFYNKCLEDFAAKSGPSAGRFCEANNFWQICINDRGRLFRCWEIPDEEEDSFGAVSDWNPEDPIRTADNPDRFTYYINASNPFANENCKGCVWFPKCLGSCPHTRRAEGYRCVPWKDDPDAYVLSVYKNKFEHNKPKDMTDG